MRDVYQTDDPAEAAMLLDKTIASCQADDVADARSLGDTLPRWSAEILAHETGASNGTAEGLNLLVTEGKRCAVPTLEGLTDRVERARAESP